MAPHRPPIFHEGQKGILGLACADRRSHIQLANAWAGWKCCKPRVLTFDEFMTIPPCTTGRHSTIDDTPAMEVPKESAEELEAKIKKAAPETTTNDTSLPPPVARAPLAVPTAAQPTRNPVLGEGEGEEDADDPDVVIPDGATCKRKSCGKSYKAGQDRDGEECVHHPGQALFHEGSKGWTCCKRRVLEFDEFMKIEGCRTKPRHLFVGKKKADADAEEQLKEIRNDFYQTAVTVIASLYLKKVDKDRSKVDFTDDGKTVELDLHTSDKKRYQTTLVLFAPIKPAESNFKILGTKLELTLAKADGTGWPVLRADDPHTGEIIQPGRAGRV